MWFNGKWKFIIKVLNSWFSLKFNKLILNGYRTSFWIPWNSHYTSKLTLFFIKLCLNSTFLEKIKISIKIHSPAGWAINKYLKRCYALYSFKNHEFEYLIRLNEKFKLQIIFLVWKNQFGLKLNQFYWET